MLIQCVKTKKTHYANVGKLKMYNKRDGDMCMSEKPSAVQRNEENRPVAQAEKQGQKSQQSGEIMNDEFRDLLYEPKEDTRRDKIFLPDVINLTPDVVPRPMILPKEEREELRAEIQEDFQQFLARADYREQQSPVSPPRQGHEVLYHDYQNTTDQPTVEQPTGTGYRQIIGDWTPEIPEYLTVPEGDIVETPRRPSTASRGATIQTGLKNTLTKVKNILSPDKEAVRQLVRRPTVPAKVPSASASTRTTRASAPGLVVDLTLPRFPLESKRGRGRGAKK
jgi:hypothetical protein